MLLLIVTKNGDKMFRKGKIVSKIRIPLEDMNVTEAEAQRQTHGKILVVTAKEPCLTCGRHRRMRFNQRIDGKLWRIDECLYCLVSVRTAANRGVK